MGILAFVLVGMVVMRRLAGRKRAMSVYPYHPLLVEARRKAAATLAILRNLHAEKAGRSQIRWVPAATYRIAEWIWSDIIELGPESCVVSVPELPDDDEEESPTRHSVNLDDIIDWQVQLPDGFIRGSFTTQAESRLAKQLGGRLSEAVGRADGRFLDT